MFYRPRILHRLWALLRGYSWIPCPICKRPFGGHEWQEGAELWITERDSVAVCPNCVAEARRANEKSGYPLVEPPSPRSRRARDDEQGGPRGPDGDGPADLEGLDAEIPDPEAADR